MEIRYTKLNTNGFACCECGREIKPDDDAAVCPDCGGVFCKPCAENGALENHVCDDNEEDWA